MTSDIRRFISGIVVLLLGSLQMAQASDALDRTIVSPQGEHVATSTPSIGDVYRQCNNGAEYVGTKASEAQRQLCIGFMAAAAQSAAQGASGTCPPLSYRQILAKVNSRISNADEWKQPALPFLVSSLQELGCTDKPVPQKPVTQQQ